MKRLVFFAIAALLALSFCGCGQSQNHEGQAQAPISASSVKGKKAEDVVLLFEKAGFTNVTSDGLGDLITGWVNHEGDVEEVSIDGDVQYSSDAWFATDAKVVIRYHSFPEKDASDDKKSEGSSASESASAAASSAAASESASAAASSAAASQTSAAASSSSSSASSASSRASEPSSSQASSASNAETASNATASSEAAIRGEDDAELQEVLSVSDPGDPIVAEFAKKHQGETIEFDGCIQHLAKCDGNSTRFDLLIGAGDYNPDSMHGPNFQFKDVSVFELNLTGDVPENLTAGFNVHIIAKVGDYSDTSQLFELEPVETRMR